MASLDALYAIQRMDPDGGEREPTEEDYRLFEQWVVDTYGRDTWEQYRRAGWGEDRGPDYFHADAYDYAD